MVGKTIGTMRVGERLIFGQYGVTNEVHPRIAWLKASPNCDFISEKVLDIIQFDQREARNPSRCEEFYYGSTDYPLSNINLFLNSENADWWTALRQYSEPPLPHQKDHFGFLYWFDDYELNTLVDKSAVRLPASNEIIGGGRFPLFSRKGVRTNAAELNMCAMFGYGERSYIEFWCMTGNGRSKVNIIDRMGYANSMYPCQNSGLRPVCRLNQDASVAIRDDGAFELVPFAVKQVQVFSDDDILNLLGLAHP